MDAESQQSMQRTLMIRNQRGLHARAAAKFVTLAATFDADISVTRNGQTVSGRSIMGLMMLAASPGTEIDVAANGVDAVAALDAIEDMIENKFEEE